MSEEISVHASSAILSSIDSTVSMPQQFFIGDVQACYESLCTLLKKIDAINPNAHLYFAGDLVNRGPQSLACLRFIKNLGSRAKTVLGNHDLHLLAIANGVRSAHVSDTLDDILQAPDREELLTWLRHQPLALDIRFASNDTAAFSDELSDELSDKLTDKLSDESSDEFNALLIHAGVYPQWTKTQTLALAKEVEEQLQGDNYVALLQQMYGNTPAQWSDDLKSYDRWRCIINALTRMRYCYADGSMDFLIKENMTQISEQESHQVMPWFALAQRQTHTTCVIFGHWSTLGLISKDNLISLDTGCVWGGQLTAVSLAPQAKDRYIVQVNCAQECVPGKLG